MNTRQHRCDYCDRDIPADKRCDYCGGCRSADVDGCCAARECFDCGKLRHDVDDSALCEACRVANHNSYEQTLASVSHALNRAGHTGSYTPTYVRHKKDS